MRLNKKEREIQVERKIIEKDRDDLQDDIDENFQALAALQERCLHRFIRAHETLNCVECHICGRQWWN